MGFIIMELQNGLFTINLITKKFNHQSKTVLIQDQTLILSNSMFLLVNFILSSCHFLAFSGQIFWLNFPDQKPLTQKLNRFIIYILFFFLRFFRSLFSLIEMIKSV